MPVARRLLQNLRVMTRPWVLDTIVQDHFCQTGGLITQSARPYLPWALSQEAKQVACVVNRGDWCSVSGGGCLVYFISNVNLRWL